MIERPHDFPGQRFGVADRDQPFPRYDLGEAAARGGHHGFAERERFQDDRAKAFLSRRHHADVPFSFLRSG